MWNNYFAQIRKKYSMRVSLKEPLVINLDGKDVTKNKKINLSIKYDNGFLDNMEKTVMHFTQKYKCISIFGADEVSFIFLTPEELIKDLNSDMNNYSNEIIAMFSQYFFDYFNNINNEEKIFWHGKCYSIPQGKVNSYIKYKKQLIENVITTYLLKRKNIIDAGKMKSSERIEICRQYQEYDEIKKIENGILYLNGDRIDIQEFLNGNIKKIEPEDKKIEDEYFDITKWDL